MKVTLDLGKLLAEGKITQEEHDRLIKFAAHGTRSLAFNILIAFGTIAVAGGALALQPDPLTGIVIGLIVLGGGLALSIAGSVQWALLANICIVIGALGLAGGVVVLDNASVASFLAIAIGFAIAGTLARSGLLIALSILALSSCLGARTDYMHATYFLGIEEPTLTVIGFSVLALVTFLASKMLRHDFERLALVAARTSLLLVNFGFWIGSLWGDEVATLVIPDEAFVVGWALALIGVGIWAARANRRWVVNLVAIFGAIHFYTQWFERLGAVPIAILLAGVIALGIALGLWQINKSLWERPAPAGA
jgi:hypothetical protein